MMMMQTWKVGHFMHCIHSIVGFTRLDCVIHLPSSCLVSFPFMGLWLRVTESTAFITFSSDEAFVGNSSALSHRLSFFSFKLFPFLTTSPLWHYHQLRFHFYHTHFSYLLSEPTKRVRNPKRFVVTLVGLIPWYTSDFDSLVCAFVVHCWFDSLINTDYCLEVTKIDMILCNIDTKFWEAHSIF